MRKDLSKSQQAVQAGHALAEFLLRGPFSFWGNGTLVYLGVRDESELKNWFNCVDNAIPFYEPDRNFEMTAFASERSDDLFKELNLL